MTTTTSPPHTRSRLQSWAALTSVLIAALGLAWWFGDVLWRFDNGTSRGDTSLLSLVPQRVVAALFVTLGALGVATAVARPGRRVGAVAAVQIVAFVGLAADMSVLVLLGYLTALAFPLLLVGCLVWGASRSRAAAIGLAALGLIASAALTLSGRIDADALRELGPGLASGLRNNLLPDLVIALFVAHGLVWAVLGVRAVRRQRGACDSCGRDDDAGVFLGWRGPVTLLAAACALPYGLLRLTWLTGMPWGMSDAELEAEPGMRLMGLLLGLAAIAGATLTIGLLRPWGQVFPRWVPRLGGRDVPVLFPTLTAGIIGAVMAVAGRSMVQSFVAGSADGEDPHTAYLFLIPLPLWGPALMLAAWGYYLHARGACAACGAGDAAGQSRPESTSRTA